VDEHIACRVRLLAPRAVCMQPKRSALAPLARPLSLAPLFKHMLCVSLTELVAATAPTLMVGTVDTTATAPRTLASQCLVSACCHARLRSHGHGRTFASSACVGPAFPSPPPGRALTQLRTQLQRVHVLSVHVRVCCSGGGSSCAWGPGWIVAVPAVGCAVVCCGAVGLWGCGGVGLWGCGAEGLWACGPVGLWCCGAVGRGLWG
jgi:hypothetical protein